MSVTPLSPDDRAAIAELLAEMGPHLQRAESLQKQLDGPVADVLGRYAKANLDATIALQRVKLGMRA